MTTGHYFTSEGYFTLISAIGGNITNYQDIRLDVFFVCYGYSGMVDLKGSGSEWRAGGTPEPRNGPPAGGQIHLPPPKSRMRKRSGFYFLPLTFSLLLEPHWGFW